MKINNSATISASPTPEQLIGFRTRDEQLSAQKTILTAPIEVVQEFMQTTILAKVESGEMSYIKPSNPEPPSEHTMWMLNS